MKKPSDLRTPFGNAFLERFKKRIQERSNAEVVHLLEYSISSNFLEQLFDQFDVKILKSKITALAIKLL